MSKLKLMDEKISQNYKSYKSNDGKVRTASLSSRAAKGSVVSGKTNYSRKHKELFSKFMES